MTHTDQVVRDIEQVLDDPPSDNSDWLTPADFKSCTECHCGHCDPDEDQWCPMAVLALVERKVEERDEKIRAVIDAVETPRLPTGAELVAAERARQIDVEGFTPDYDRGYGPQGWRVLLQASQMYAGDGDGVEWPWPAHTHKPSNPPRNMVKAGALAVAALEAAQRAGTATDAELLILRDRPERCADLIDQMITGVAEIGGTR